MTKKTLFQTDSVFFIIFIIVVLQTSSHAPESPNPPAVIIFCGSESAPANSSQMDLVC